LNLNFSLLIRFLLVGVINSAFGYGIFASLVFLGLHYSLALLISSVLGILFNFKSTGIVIFGSRNNKLLLRFLLVYLVAYFINLSLIDFLLICGFNSYVSAAICLPPLAIFSFFMNSKFVFNK
jgi:putative flippase GtrA